MLTYDEMSQQPRPFLALTGYTVAEFQALLPYFKAAFLAWGATKTLTDQARLHRAYGLYRNCPLPTMPQKRFFILVYLKQHPTQTLLGGLFGMPQPVANAWIHRLQPCVNQALAAAGELPAREAAPLCFRDPTERVFWHDETERPIPRPTDPDQQRNCYSGKRKRHMVKHNLLSNARGRVRFLSRMHDGHTHDKRIADEDAYRVPAGSALYQDTGFQGFTLPGVTIHQPKQKPRGKPLTPEEKLANQGISRIRIRIEHGIGSVKRYRIIKETIRNWKPGFRDQVMETCCGLHNFRLNFRPWHYDVPLTNLNHDNVWWSCPLEFL